MSLGGNINIEGNKTYLQSFIELLQNAQFLSI